MSNEVHVVGDGVSGVRRALGLFDTQSTFNAPRKDFGISALLVFFVFLVSYGHIARVVGFQASEESTNTMYRVLLCSSLRLIIVCRCNTS